MSLNGTTYTANGSLCYIILHYIIIDNETLLVITLYYIGFLAMCSNTSTIPFAFGCVANSSRNTAHGESLYSLRPLSSMVLLRIYTKPPCLWCFSIQLIWYLDRLQFLILFAFNSSQKVKPLYAQCKSGIPFSV
jgi:hypothetical protein